MRQVAEGLGAAEAVVGPRGDPSYPLARRVYAGLGTLEVGEVVPMTRVRD
jgi:hypothetical protein